MVSLPRRVQNISALSWLKYCCEQKQLSWTDAVQDHIAWEWSCCENQWGYVTRHNSMTILGQLQSKDEDTGMSLTYIHFSNTIDKPVAGSRRQCSSRSHSSVSRSPALWSSQCCLSRKNYVNGHISRRSFLRWSFYKYARIYTCLVPVNISLCQDIVDKLSFSNQFAHLRFHHCNLSLSQNDHELEFSANSSLPVPLLSFSKATNPSKEKKTRQNLHYRKWNCKLCRPKHRPPSLPSDFFMETRGCSDFRENDNISLLGYDGEILCFSNHICPIIFPVSLIYRKTGRIENIFVYMFTYPDFSSYILCDSWNLHVCLIIDAKHWNIKCEVKHHSNPIIDCEKYIRLIDQSRIELKHFYQYLLPFLTVPEKSK